MMHSRGLETHYKVVVVSPFAGLNAVKRHQRVYAAVGELTGDVRRALRAAQFDVTKRPGFGAKRQMLVGRFIGANPFGLRRTFDFPWMTQRNRRRSARLSSGFQVWIRSCDECPVQRRFGSLRWRWLAMCCPVSLW